MPCESPFTRELDASENERPRIFETMGVESDTDPHRAGLVSEIHRAHSRSMG